MPLKCLTAAASRDLSYYIPVTYVYRGIRGTRITQKRRCIRGVCKSFPVSSNYSQTASALGASSDSCSQVTDTTRLMPSSLKHCQAFEALSGLGRGPHQPGSLPLVVDIPSWARTRNDDDDDDDSTDRQRGPLCLSPGQENPGQCQPDRPLVDCDGDTGQRKARTAASPRPASGPPTLMASARGTTSASQRTPSLSRRGTTTTSPFRSPSTPRRSA